MASALPLSSLITVIVVGRHRSTLLSARARKQIDRVVGVDVDVHAALIGADD